MKILFYSTKCGFCLKILENIKLLDINDIKFICIDNNNNLPSKLEKVPTLIIPDINEPLVGNKAFKWLEMQKNFNNSTNNINFAEKFDDSIFSNTENLNKKDKDDDIDDYIDYSYLNKLTNEKSKNQKNEETLTKNNQQNEINKMISLRNNQINNIFFNKDNNKSSNNNNNVRRSNLN